MVDVIPVRLDPPYCGPQSSPFPYHLSVILGSQFDSNGGLGRIWEGTKIRLHFCTPDRGVDKSQLTPSTNGLFGIMI